MPQSPLPREEHIEQAYFFRVFRERLLENQPTQDILEAIHQEVLSTTKLPMALDFLRGEVLLNGKLGGGMSRLLHYFTPFQAFVMGQAEEEKSRFDHLTALLILQREAEYRSQTITPAGLFIYQFECLSRNRLGYDKGLLAMQADPMYDEQWSKWLHGLRLQLGAVEFPDLIYFSSEQYPIDQRRQTRDPDFQTKWPLLFGAKEGRIAWANRGKDPLYLFAALQRQLGYPMVPQAKRSTHDDQLSPAAIHAKLVLLEKRLAVLDSEFKGQLKLDEYTVKPSPDGGFPDDPLVLG